MGQRLMDQVVSDTDTAHRTGLKQPRRMTKGQTMPRNEYFANLVT
jgi:hypothetical protein